MKILITGNKGFIGQNMYHAFNGIHDIMTYDWGDPIPNFKDRDLVIHLGAITSTTETDVDKVLDQNYDFSRWLINACQEFKIDFQYASSASVYGKGSEFKEDSPLDPRTPYAWSKLLFERYVEKMKDRWTIKVQGFRYFNVYGPYEDHKGDQASPYHKFDQQAVETGVIKLFKGSENFKRDFIHVDEIIDIHRIFMDVDESGVWNAGTGKVKSFFDVAREISHKRNAKIQQIPMPDSLKHSYQEYTCADVTELRKHYPKHEKDSS